MASGSIDLGSNAGAGITKAVSLTTAQRYALVPYDGTVVYDSSLRCLFIYNVDRWFPAQPVDPVSGFLIHEDWLNNISTGNNVFAVAGNTGTDNGMIFDSATGAVGQVYVEQANAGPGYTSLYYGNAFALGAQSLFFDARSYVSALSTVAQEFTANVGFGDQVDATTYTEGIYFCYDRATDGDFWSCKTTSSSVTTKTVTAVAPVGGTYQTLSVAYYGGSVKFYIAGALVATHTTNLTTALIGPKIRIVKTVGATARRLETDFFTTYSFFNTRRV